MEQIIDLLHEKGCSCVIKNNDEIREYNRRGVIDIYELINNDPKFLKGAFLADKVIGKGAAALMIKGEVNKVYTNILSEPALNLFKENNIDVNYNILVPNIINRDKTGFCPLETLCIATNDISELLLIIEGFINKMMKNK